MNTLKSLWRNLRTSFWFVPSLIIGAGIALAVALIEVDSTRNGQWLAHWPRLFGASAAGARVMLSTIAGSMMTVVGVTFSMTLVALALASSQYTSRILRNFMRDRVTQVVLGIFSGMGDFARDGDSMSLYGLRGLSGHLDPSGPGPHDPYYVGSVDAKDPVLSPIYADLHGLPPSLFVTSTRDLLLSGTVNLHRAYLNAGVDARLVVFDALPHAFWYDPLLPESLEANHTMADFFVKQLGKSGE